MTDTTELLELSDLRGIAALMVIDEPVSPLVAEVARETLDTMKKEAAEHGFSEADVVRAILTPVFQRRSGCNCHSCLTRRANLGYDGGQHGQG
ncbi:MAG: hypothetical protein ACRDIB_10930, partial [Ardenticatenaceae bacterium]